MKSMDTDKQDRTGSTQGAAADHVHAQVETYATLRLKPEETLAG